MKKNTQDIKTHSTIQYNSFIYHCGILQRMRLFYNLSLETCWNTFTPHWTCFN